MEALVQSWSTFTNEFDTLEADHVKYLRTLEQMHRAQDDEKRRVKLKYAELARLKEVVRRLTEASTTSDSERQRLLDITTELSDCKTHLADILDELPRDSNGLYLSVILGTTVDVSLMSKNDKFRYKDEYEKFKFTVTIVALVTMTLAYVSATRVTDAITHFLLVWYYCTLTIRESVLIVNGSKIKGWWLYHHFVTCVLCGIMLTWPDTACYRQFRIQFLATCFYIGIVTLLQCQYQRGCLRRLRALGHRHAMDITVEGFHSWMFKGLTFLLPFLVFGYMLQLYNGFMLLRLWFGSDCADWQACALGLLFLTVCIGNSSTTARVCYRKFVLDRNKRTARRRLTTKYSTTTLPRNPKTSPSVDADVMDAVFKDSEQHETKKSE